MYPHDYHDWEGHPFMHNRGEARPYVEPDIYASAHDAAIPIISTIGRGPKGKGVYAKQDPETGVIKIYEDENDEVIATIKIPTSPTITVTEPVNVYPGQSNVITFIITNDGVTSQFPVTIPCGEPGSISFFSDGQYDLSTPAVWVPIAKIGFDMEYDGYSYEKPDPRINDFVLLEPLGGGGVWSFIMAIDFHDFNDGQGEVLAALCVHDPSYQ